jgi:hypothetical protein
VPFQTSAHPIDALRLKTGTRRSANAALPRSGSPVARTPRTNFAFFYFPARRKGVFSVMPWRFVDYWQMTHDADLDNYRSHARPTLAN